MATWTGKGSGMYLDYSLFKTGFTKIATKTIPDKVEKAEFAVGAMVIKDAILETPKVPRDIGDLQASGEIHPERSPIKIGVLIGFNKDYAAKWHEAVGKKVNWSLDGSGPKYLEAKLSRLKEKYMRFFASLISP